MFCQGLTTSLRHISFPVAILISALSWGLGIPVDHRGLATFKNHFFHSLNTASCLLSMLVLDQEWRSSSVILPFRYGIAYALMTWILQTSGGHQICQIKKATGWLSFFLLFQR